MSAPPQTPARVAGLLLAAGEGRRYGKPKALVELDGQTLAARGVRLLADGGCDPVVVVAGAAPLRWVVADAIVVDNPHWRTGMGSSLRAGLHWLASHGPPDVAAAVVALVDQPWVVPEAVSAVRAGWRPGGIAVATYAGRRGHPVLLDRVLWEQAAAAAQGDAGARDYLAANPGLVTEVPCPGSPKDVDTPADLAPPPSS